MALIRTGLLFLLALLAAACSGTTVGPAARPPPQPGPSAAAPTPTPSAAAPTPTPSPPPTIPPDEVPAAREYAAWIIDNFDTIADQAEILVALIVSSDPSSDVWVGSLEDAFGRLAELVKTAQEREAPVGLFAFVHRFYTAGLSEYEAASDLFFVWIADREEGEPLSEDVGTRLEQGQHLMHETLIPVFRQAQERLPTE